MSPVDIDLADRRIAEQERELARIQFETIPLQLEVNLMRERLDRALTSGLVIAHASIAVLDKIGDSFEESVERMQRDLNGRE